jgi:hypothetical protein
MQYLQDRAGEICAVTRLMHSVTALVKRVVAKHPLRASILVFGLEIQRLVH